MKAVIALSGGMDSTTLFYWALNKGYELIAVSFYYGQNHSKETGLAKQHCERMGVSHKEIDISFLKDITKGVSSLTSGADKIPEGMYNQNNMKSTVVPFRNGIILSILAAVAETENCDLVLYGAHSGDHAIYPDCRADFEKSMADAIYRGTYNDVVMKAPFVEMDKISILSTGKNLGVDYSQTWTCYKGGEEPCGKCGSCVERTEAFLQNNMADPLYSLKNWKNAVDYYKNVSKKD